MRKFVLVNYLFNNFAKEKEEEIAPFQMKGGLLINLSN
jgi:hypothetical protein